jgi:nuclear transport factor 2 (NTF2) superfamily protein
VSGAKQATVRGLRAVEVRGQTTGCSAVSRRLDCTPDDRDDRSDVSSIEETNMERTRLWELTWNSDPMRMVDECYAPDCEVRDMIRGLTFHGREELRAVEKQILATDSTRRMKITKMVPSGDTVAVEMDAYWLDDTVSITACVVLTFGADGLILSDHTYSGDPLGTVGLA